MDIYKNCAIFRILRVRRDSTPWVLSTTETVTVQYWCTTSQTKTHSRRSVHVHWKCVVLHVLCFRQGRWRGLNSLSCFVMWNDQLGKGECCYKIYQLLAAVICTCTHPLMIGRSGTLHLMSGICNKTGCVMYSVCTGNSHDDYGS